MANSRIHSGSNRAAAPAPVPAEPQTRATGRPDGTHKGSARTESPTECASGSAGDIGYGESGPGASQYDDETLMHARHLDSLGLDGFHSLGLKRPESDMSELELLGSYGFDEEDEDEEEEESDFDRLMKAAEIGPA
jgi:hypothetical protein